MSSSDGRIILYLLAGFFGGLWFVYTGTKKYLLVQKINNTPTSKAESAAVGLVELIGKMGDEGDLPSPVSGVSCGYWKLVAEYYKSGKNGGWRKFFSSESGKPFYIEDETGQVLVDPTRAEVDIPSDCQFQGYLSGKGVFGVEHTKMDDRVLRFIDQSDPSTKARFNGYQHVDVRVTESYIAKDDPLYVLGTAVPRDGASSAVGHENLVVKKGPDVMYISDSDQGKIVSRLSGSFKWEIFGGAALSGICLLILLLIFNV